MLRERQDPSPAGVVVSSRAEVGAHQSRRSVLFVAGALLAAGFVAAAAAASLLPITQQPSPHSQARRRLDLTLLGTILGSEECTTEYDTLSFVPLYFALILYTFLGLAIVCDEYFCESLEQISSALSLSDDVAGATFMAAGSSAPELFTAIITVFIAPGEQGVGTIVGSAVFNICVIVGITSLCAGQVLQLWWYPLMRDSTVYAASILLMLWAMSDGQVTPMEAGTLVSCYVLYVAIMIANGRIVELLTQRERRRALEKHEDLSPNPFRKFIGLNPTMQPAFKVAHNHKTQVRRKVQREQVQQMLMTAITVNRVRSKLVSRLSSRSTFKPEDEGVEGGSDEACSDKMMDVISWPMAKAMALTIPDCREEGCQACLESSTPIHSVTAQPPCRRPLPVCPTAQMLMIIRTPHFAEVLLPHVHDVDHVDRCALLRHGRLCGARRLHPGRARVPDGAHRARGGHLGA